MVSPDLNAALVELAQSGKRSAQEALWRAHRRWVAAIVLAHKPRRMDVEDLMQDVAIKMIDKLHMLRDAQAFKPWLRQIIINTCRGAARSMKASRAGENVVHLADTDAAHPAAQESDAAESLEMHDSAKRLLEHVMSLPSDYREPLLLRCIQSMSYHQISEILDLPVTTVETRLARARKMLREECGKDIAPMNCSKYQP